MNIAAKATTVTDTSAIKFLSGSLAGRVFPLAKPEITIGSDVHNDIVIRDDPGIASYHARLLWSNGSWMIQKHPLATKLTINSQAAQQARLEGKATVGLGESSFLLLVGSEARLALEMHTHNHLAAEHALQEPTQRASQLDATSIAPLSAIGIPSLTISSKTSRNQRGYLLDKPVISIGRDPSNDIVVDEPIVSAFHAQVVRQDNRLILVHPHPERQHTLNGLLYQGRKVRGDEHFTKELAPGDIFRIGDEDGTFVTLAYDDGNDTQQDALPPMRPFKLTGTAITIGRSPDNTLVLSHPQVSAHHARLQPEGGTYRLFDLGSTNHVYVNGQLVTNHLLRMHDEILLGPYWLLYEGTQLAEYDESRYIRVDALNLKKVADNGVTLLNNISLSIPPRAFVAIVGGSGAGKSTLMAALNGFSFAVPACVFLEPLAL